MRHRAQREVAGGRRRCRSRERAGREAARARRPPRSARRRRHPIVRSSQSTAGGRTWCASSTTRSEFRHRIVMCKNELSLGVGAERLRRDAALLRRGAVPVTSPAMTRAPASYVRRRDCRGPGGRRRQGSARWGRRPYSSPSTAPARIRHRYDAAAMACFRAIEVSSEESTKIPGTPRRT